MPESNYVIETRNGVVRAGARVLARDALIIRDLGPFDVYMSVTNNAERVVGELFAQGELRANQALFYFDSEGDLDEIRHAGRKFVGFRPGVRRDG